MFRKVAVVIFLITLIVQSAAGQDVKVRGKFLPDSLKIGEAVPYSLTVSYPSALQLLLPDSAWSFSPFEFKSRKFFPTRTVNNVSRDSVIYYLETYEIDSVQTLRLPAFVLHGRDCTLVESNTDTIVLKQLVRVKVDSLEAPKLPLKVNTDYLNVSWLLNYPILLLIAAVLFTALIVLWIIFGKRIIRHYKLKRMTRLHAVFVKQFTDSVQQLHQDFSPSAAESIFVLWKKYMENLVSRPYTRYTAREILRMEKNEMLGSALNVLNRIIYAGVNTPSSDDAFTQIRQYTDQQFVKKSEEVKHG